MQQHLTLQTLISNDRLANIIRYSELCRSLEGTFAEIGVFRGGSLELIAQLHPEKEIYGIDSFEGLPEVDDKDTFHKKGDFKEVEFYSVKGFFRTKYRNVELFKGFTPEVFSAIDPFKMFSFVHIDVDLFLSVKHSLDYFYPRMVPGGIIILDDYGFDSTSGAKIAVDEFVSNRVLTHKEELLYYSGGPSHKQYLIVK